MTNIEQLARNLINTIYESDKRLGYGDRCVEENEAIETLEKALNNLPTYATCYTPLNGKGAKWNLSTVLDGKYKGEIVCIMVVFSDNQCIVDFGGDNNNLDVLNLNDLEPWIRVDSVNINKREKF